jgi:hypothetical protein
MRQLTTVLQKIQLPKAFAGVLLSLAFVVGLIIGQFVYPDAAHASITSPKSPSYQVDRGNYHLSDDSSVLPDAGGVVESIQDGAETVKEKLNLDQPLPESTQLFFKQIRGEDVEFKDPVPSNDVREPQNQ